MSYSYDSATDQETIARYQQLNGEVNELTAEVRDLRDENEALLSELQQQKTANRPAAKKEVAPKADLPAQNAVEQELATVIVYKDGHHREVRSFAIVGKTLWILSEQRAQKIPLADLDLDATEKANAERGIDFSMPVTK